jgi:hypothetical protein
MYDFPFHGVASFYAGICLGYVRLQILEMPRKAARGKGVSISLCVPLCVCVFIFLLQAKTAYISVHLTGLASFVPE